MYSLSRWISFGPSSFSVPMAADGAVFEHDLLAQQRGGTDAAYGREAQEAVVVDMGDHDADLVHVRGDHERGGPKWPPCLDAAR